MKKIDQLLIVNLSKVKNETLKKSLKTIQEDYKKLSEDQRAGFEKDFEKNIASILKMVQSRFPNALEDEDDKGNRSKVKKATKGMTKKMTEKDVDRCNHLIKEMRALLSKHSATTPKDKPLHKKKVSTMVADSLLKSISSPIRKEMGATKVKGLKVPKLKEAEKHFSQGLKYLRQGLGGISDGNDQFIKHFEDGFADLLKEVTEAQKKAE